MYFANLTYFLFCLLLSLLSGTTASLQLLPGLLLPRQTDLTIPGECQPACQGFVGLYNKCRTTTIPDDCFCTSSTLEAMKSCYVCFIVRAQGQDAALAVVGNGSPSTSNADNMKKIVQDAIDRFVATCKAEGYPVDGSNRATTSPYTTRTAAITTVIEDTRTSSTDMVIQTTSTTSTTSTYGVTSFSTGTANAFRALSAFGLGIVIMGTIVGFGLV